MAQLGLCDAVRGNSEELLAQDNGDDAQTRELSGIKTQENLQPGNAAQTVIAQGASEVLWYDSEFQEYCK